MVHQTSPKNSLMSYQKEIAVKMKQEFNMTMRDNEIIDNARNVLPERWRDFRDKMITENSGELISQFGGDDTTCIWAGTDAAKFVDYVSNLLIILHPILSYKR